VTAKNPSLVANIPGLYEPGFAIPIERIPIDVATLSPNYADDMPMREVEVQDARALQAETDPTKFFSDYGFVLLEHRTSVTHWNTDPTNSQADNPITNTYGPEVEGLIREVVLPNSGLTYIYQPPNVNTRSAAADTEPYAFGVHQDYGITADEYQDNLVAFTGKEIAANWRSAVDRSAHGRFVALSLWRPIHMTQPLQHMPLALCDPRTVRLDDLVPTSLVNFSPSGLPTLQMGLRYHPDQRWYYYPDMTVDEVLVINQFDLRRGEPAVVRSCFHTAFELPDAPPNVQTRHSCEYRPQVFF